MDAERRLVLRAQSGDREAFDLLLRDVAPRLLGYVARVTADRALAEDVVQETLITIVKKIRWLHDPALFRAWAYRIASREAFRALRKRHARIAEPLGEIAFVEERIDPWQRERLLASLDRLSPASRAVITLHYIEELPLSEIAAILELSIGTVKSRLAYGLAQLRKEYCP
ncbi:MAG TPA: sigma-70 family RNA polymerase sigma factor [Thermoanaerobaculia bacterium]|nr:sigma-70 family RNA polymerase sigma factor [Thermoanaerobaculia bacterium]